MLGQMFSDSGIVFVEGGNGTSCVGTSSVILTSTVSEELGMANEDVHSRYLRT